MQHTIKYLSLFLLSLLLLFACNEEKKKVENANPTLTDYWDGNADWQLYYNLPISGWHEAAGTSIRVVDETWYWFQRYQIPNNPERVGIECRKSTDKGLTWSDPVKVINPEAGTPWERMATDGDFYYDAPANKWRCLFQSLADTGGWTCSYLERDGADPMGLFTTPVGFINPAIDAKEIWSRIADDPDDDAVKLCGGALNQIYDEGTPEILWQGDDTFYITFHGAANIGASIWGFRGIATTTDFQHYTPAAPDCIMDAYDTNKWNVAWQGDLNGNVGSIGVGAATTLQEGSYWYTLIEGADKSLIGTDGQNWTFGLFRSTFLTSTEWENWADNPVPLFAPHQELLEWQYARLFKDEGVTYCAINKANPASERSFRIYKLVWESMLNP